MTESVTSLRNRVKDIVVRTYKAPYDHICGRHPHLRPWHSQWLSGELLYSDLRPILATVGGDVLDVGCGDKPYEQWIPAAKRYVGIDVSPGPRVDVVIEPGRRWGLADEQFDVALCTQVLEHATDVDHVLAEIRRVLKPGGLLVTTAPFIFNEHGAPHDYRRFSIRGLELLLPESFEIRDSRRQGGIGSTVGVLILNWVELTFAHSIARVLLFTVLLPLWIVFSALVNAFGAALDRLDRSGAFYGNVLVLATKTPEGDSVVDQTDSVFHARGSE